MLSEGADKVRAAEVEFDFHPVTTWLGKPVTERVEGWLTEVRQCRGGGGRGGYGVIRVAVYTHTLAAAAGRHPCAHPQVRCAACPPQVYECSGSMVAAACRKVPVVLPPGASFDDYLTLPLPADELEEVPLGLPTPAGAPSAVSAHADAASSGSAVGGGSGDLFKTTAAAAGHSSSPAPRKQKASKRAQKFSSRCWLARGFPVLLQQVIPLLDVVAAGNKHFAQAAAYLRRFQSDEYFPVRVQVPLLFTTYLMISFRMFELLKKAPEPEFFEVRWRREWTESKDRWVVRGASRR